MLMAKSPASSAHILLLQGHFLIESIHAKQPNKEGFCLSSRINYSIYGTHQWVKYNREFWLWTLSWNWVNFLALVPVRLRKDQDTSAEMWQLSSKTCRHTFRSSSVWLGRGLRVVRKRRGPPLLLLSTPTELVRSVGDVVLCQERGRLIEKLKRKHTSFQCDSEGFVLSPCKQMCQLQNKAHHIEHQITVEGEITQSL